MSTEEDRKRQQEIDYQLVVQSIWQLAQQNTQEYALYMLSIRRKIVPNFALMLWNSNGTIFILLEEILKVLPAINPPTLNAQQSRKICNAMSLLQSLAWHAETRLPFFRTHPPFFLYPFIQSVSKTLPIEDVRLASLRIIGTLMKMEQKEIIVPLLTTEIVPLCLCIMDAGSLKCKLRATYILHKILRNDDGLSYVCYTFDRFAHVSMMLGNIIISLVNNPHRHLLYLVLQCYIRLADNPYARSALRQCLPHPFKDNMFKEYFEKVPSMKFVFMDLWRSLEKEC